MFPGVQHAVSSWWDHGKASRWPTLTHHQSITQTKSSPFTLWDGSNPSFLRSPFSSAQLPGRLALASIHSFNHRGTQRPLMNSGGAQTPITTPSTLYVQENRAGCPEPDRTGRTDTSVSGSETTLPERPLGSRSPGWRHHRESPRCSPLHLPACSSPDARMCPRAQGQCWTGPRVRSPTPCKAVAVPRPDQRAGWSSPHPSRPSQQQATSPQPLPSPRGPSLWCFLLQASLGSIHFPPD